MGPRFGLILPLSALLAATPFGAWAQQAPISLAPVPPPVPAASGGSQSGAAASPSSAAAMSPAAVLPTASTPMRPDAASSDAAPSDAALSDAGRAGTRRARTRRNDTRQTVTGKAGDKQAKPTEIRGLSNTPLPSVGAPRTLNEALATTYTNQPALQAERARLRATDEAVPTALAGWRPQVQINGAVGYGDGTTRSYNVLSGRTLTSPGQRQIATAAAQVTQPLYTGGRTQANINRAKNQVMAERATLIAQEQTSFTQTVNAYVGVIQRTQELDLNRNNEIVLQKQLQATNDRFRVGEITRTDVAQAEAALAGARAQRETSEGTLQTARGVFQQIVGVLPPAGLIPPQPLAVPVKTEAEAIAQASTNNPQVVAALFTDSAARDAVDVAFAQLMPQLSLQGQTFQQQNSGGRSVSANGYQVTANLTVPLYQGGSEYAAVRQARQQQQLTDRQLADARRTAVQNAVQAWETLASAKAAAQSTRAQIRANEIALEGVEREAIVGSRTTLDVLNAQQQLLNSRTSLVQNLAQVVNASYAVAAAIGRLTARDIHLPVPLYDETAYYNAVRDKWIGVGDQATDQPGR